MDQLVTQFSKRSCKASVPVIKPGYLIDVHQKIKEGNKERVQVFGGTVIAVSHGHGVNSTITVRRIASGVGVERVFPVHSPNIVKIEIKRAHKVRRAKLNFLRGLFGKALRLKEVAFTPEEITFDNKRPEDIAAEAAQAEAETASKAEETPTPEVSAEAPKEEAKEEDSK